MLRIISSMRNPLKRVMGIYDVSKFVTPSQQLLPPSFRSFSSSDVEKNRSQLLGNNSQKTSVFNNLLSKLPEGAGKERIQAALDSCADIPDEDYLRSIIAGLTRKEVTSLLQQAPLSLTLYDASALAGLLFAPTGG
jgi:hypothetical protein